MATWLTSRHPLEGDEDLGVTMLELTGPRPGPRVAILGGVHGDETQGVRSVLAVRGAVQAIQAGSLVLVPVAHEAAVRVGTRVSPLDGENLARDFPGDAHGGPTLRLAALLSDLVLDRADVVIDLHSSGIHYAMPLLIGVCDDGSPGSRDALGLAHVARLPVTWRHPGPPPPGRSGSAAHARGSPFVYLESSEATDWSLDYRDAVLRMLEWTGVLAPGTARSSVAGQRRRLVGPGDLDAVAIRAPIAGLCEVHVGTLERVQAGQEVAVQWDPMDGTRRVIFASADGVVVMHRTTRWAMPGDLLVFLTGEEEMGLA